MLSSVWDNISTSVNSRSSRDGSSERSTGGRVVSALAMSRNARICLLHLLIAWRCASSNLLEFNPGEIEIRDGFVSAFAQRPFPSLALE
jgi:hypothetical protein